MATINMDDGDDELSFRVLKNSQIYAENDNNIINLGALGISQLISDGESIILNITGATTDDIININDKNVDIRTNVIGSTSLLINSETADISSEWISGSHVSVQSGGGSVLTIRDVSNSLIETGDGDDIIHVTQSASHSNIAAGAGNDSITVKESYDANVFGEDGDDILVAGYIPSSHTLQDGGKGDDIVISFAGGMAAGGEGNNTLITKKYGAYGNTGGNDDIYAWLWQDHWDKMAEAAAEPDAYARQKAIVAEAMKRSDEFSADMEAWLAARRGPPPTEEARQAMMARSPSAASIQAATRAVYEEAHGDLEAMREISRKTTGEDGQKTLSDLKTMGKEFENLFSYRQAVEDFKNLYLSRSRQAALANMGIVGDSFMGDILK
jgi:hypothetical protein